MSFIFSFQTPNGATIGYSAGASGVMTQKRLGSGGAKVYFIDSKSDADKQASTCLLNLQESWDLFKANLPELKDIDCNTLTCVPEDLIQQDEDSIVFTSGVTTRK